MGNAVSLGQARFARLDEFEVLRRRGDVPFPELVVDHDTRFGQVTDHRHLALFSFVRDVCGLLLGHDLRGVPVLACAPECRAIECASPPLAG